MKFLKDMMLIPISLWTRNFWFMNKRMISSSMLFTLIKDKNRSRVDMKKTYSSMIIFQFGAVGTVKRLDGVILAVMPLKK